MSNANTVIVKLFAVYQEAYKVPELMLELPDGTTVAGVCDRLISEHPELAQWREITRFGVNLQFVEPDTVLQDGDEVVLIPRLAVGKIVETRGTGASLLYLDAEANETVCRLIRFR